MPVVRFARDRRGYEHTYLVHVATHGGRSSSRLLYWFRTPPGVKVGRAAFDEGTRRALEAQYPDLTFDWETIVSTPIPSPAVDWRARRQADRAAKAEMGAARQTSDNQVAREEIPSEDVADIRQLAERHADLAVAAAEGAPALPDSRVASRTEPAQATRSEMADRAAGVRKRRRGGRNRRRGPKPHAGTTTPDSGSLGRPASSQMEAPDRAPDLPPDGED